MKNICLNNLEVTLRSDLKLVLDDYLTIKDFANISGVSERTLKYIILNKEYKSSYETLDKIYSAFYMLGYRINDVKEELIKESSNNIALFHGSKNGIDLITANGSRDNCDFGKGFYLGESYNQAKSFVFDYKQSFVYSFLLDIKDLKVLKFNCDLKWLLAVCYYRKHLDKYKDNKYIKPIIDEINNCDVIIAPIADNRMFYIMESFYQGDITSEVAVHSLSASSLGFQYVIKSEKALNRLKVIEKHFLSTFEKKQTRDDLNKRADLIDSKLKISKREYNGKGKYIDEIFN